MSNETLETVIFGGSFDPIHLGHLKVIHYTIEHFNVEKFLLLPSKASPFKRGGYSLSDCERLRCIALSLDDYADLFGKAERAKITVDTYETTSKKECSYTADTVSHYIKDEGFSTPINFIIGDDILHSLSAWKNIDYLKTHVHFVVFRRDPQTSEISTIRANLEASGFNLTFLENPLYDYSSTAVKEGNGSLLSKRVAKYLSELHKN